MHGEIIKTRIFFSPKHGNIIFQENINMVCLCPPLNLSSFQICPSLLMIKDKVSVFVRGVQKRP